METGTRLAEIGNEGESVHASSAIWSLTDRFFLPPSGPFERLTGWRRTYETHENKGDGWKLKSTRIERLRVEVR